MVRFKVEYQDNVTLDAAHPSSPPDFAASMSAYLEDQLSQGFEFAGLLPNGNGAANFIFRVVAK